jgi:hypothetical protein
MFELTDHSPERQARSPKATHSNVDAIEVLSSDILREIPDDRSLDSELRDEEKRGLEAAAAIIRIEQALKRIQGYLVELRRTLNETQDPDVVLVIEQRERQRQELENRLWNMRAAERQASRRQEEILAIFENDSPTKRDPLPPAFAHARATFFTDLLNPDRSNPFATREWMMDPRIRKELCEFLTQHVPHFILIQETLIQAYQEKYPHWSQDECVAYTRKILPFHLKQLALMITHTARSIEAQDPKAPVAPIYEEGAQLLLHSLDRTEGAFPDGRILWDSLAQITRPDSQVRMLLATHQRIGAPEETRQAIFHRLSRLIDEAVGHGQESAMQAQNALRALRKLVPDLTATS